MSSHTNSPVTILFSDFDGTLYDPSWKVLLSPFYNIKTKNFILQKTMRFIIVTGRATWGWFDEFQLTLLGLPKPDSVIYGAGTYISHRNSDGILADDTQWNIKIQKTIVSWTNPSLATNTWSKPDIEKNIEHVLSKWLLSCKPTPNPFIIIIPIFNFQIQHLQACMKQVSNLTQKGIKILLTEKLYLPNTTSLFNGYMLLVPETAGKDEAVCYYLDQYNKKNVKPECLLFGDALVDVPMLSKDLRQYTKRAFSYGVHLTPLALANLKILDSKSNISHFPGSAPKALLRLIKKYVEGNPIAAQAHVKIVEPV